MDARSKISSLFVLAIGDALAILAAVLIGFQFHGETGAAGERLVFTLLPLLVAWFLAAWPLGLFASSISSKISLTIVRVLWVMALAAPLAAILRSAWLGIAAVPVFALVLGLSTGLGVVLWRLLFIVLIARRGTGDA